MADQSMESGVAARQSGESIDEAFQRRRCCFFFQRNSAPSPAGGLTWWQKVSTEEAHRGGSIWSRGVSALKKVREWSEIVAGPRWKTFIRRFNRSGSRGGGGKHLKLQYDPLSYAMNFDDGPGQNGNSVEDGDDGYYSRNFSSRYAKGSMDLSKDGTSFV